MSDHFLGIFYQPPESVKQILELQKILLKMFFERFKTSGKKNFLREISEQKSIKVRPVSCNRFLHPHRKFHTQVRR
jgi:hypothetical protein